MPDQKQFTELRRRQLDRLFAQPHLLRALPDLRRGFISEIRGALGMSTYQLARRLEISQPAATKLEQRERDGTISLNSLRKAAEALDCNLVYAFVPKRSLLETLRVQALRAARDVLDSVGR